MLDLILLLLGTIMSITAFQTLSMYAMWYYDRRNFPETSQVPAQSNEVLLLPGLWGVFTEWLAISLLVVSYPLRLVHDASPVRTRVQGETPIILVHGYGGNAANFLTLQWRLKQRGWANVYAVSYTPPTIDARKLAQQVTDHVGRPADPLCPASPRPGRQARSGDHTRLAACRLTYRCPFPGHGRGLPDALSKRFPQ
jgi:hypothetical protein